MAVPELPVPQSSVDLLRLLAAGDDDAAAAIFERYAERLTRLARSRLARRLAQRIDAEDIMMSAYRSFFVAARQGRFELERGGDLWRLLVEVTLHKLYRSVQHHHAQRRSVGRELHRQTSREGDVPIAAAEPTPEEAAIAAEELEAVLKRLPERGRLALELRMQGYEHEEIAERLSCNERTVRRWLNEARRILVARGGAGFVPSAARRRPRSGKSPPTNTRIVANLKAAATLVWSDYLLREQIGIGATGKVYRAIDKIRDCEIAVKFLKKALSTSAAATEQFIREAHTVAELADPGIVTVHGIGLTPGGGLFLAMDLVRGSDLERLRRAGPVEPVQAAVWLANAARIVHKAHERGVIHCDLKPSNLLLDEKSQIRVTDFGLAVRLPQAAGGVLAGTPAFMAPEQVDSVWGPISRQTDVWGLGSVLYFLLNGRPPHVGNDVSEVLANVVSGRPIELADESNSALQPIVAITRRCLAKHPEGRFASALELAEALESAVKIGSPNA